MQLKIEIGQTGTIFVSGIISQADYNQELTGIKRIDIYDQMLKGDATVRAAYLAVTLPVMSANWYIVTPKGMEEDKASVEMKEFIDNAMFHDIGGNWTQFLREVLKYLGYGSQVFEKVFKIRDDGKIGWEKFAVRLPKTIYKWTIGDGKTPGITQLLPVGGIREIEDWKLIKFVNEQEGINFEGQSIFRAAYKHWYFKENYYKIDSIAQERQGLGIPVVHVPPGATAEDRAAVEEMLKNLRVNEQAHVQLPVGFTMEYLDMKINGTKNPKDMILHHDRQISKSVLAQFLELGGTAGGSFALSANQSELFLLSIQSVAKYIQEKMNEAIKELIDLNFPGTTDYPALEVGRIGTIDFKALADALWRLTQGGLLVPDDDIEKYLRNAMDLPEAAQTTEDDHEEPVTIDRADMILGRQKFLNPKGGDAPAGKAPATTAKEFKEDMQTLSREIQEAIHAEESKS
jgi:hypothetical protein